MLFNNVTWDGSQIWTRLWLTAQKVSFQTSPIWKSACASLHSNDKMSDRRQTLCNCTDKRQTRRLKMKYLMFLDKVTVNTGGAVNSIQVKFTVVMYCSHWLTWGQCAWKTIQDTHSLTGRVVTTVLPLNVKIILCTYIFLVVVAKQLWRKPNWNC